MKLTERLEKQRREAEAADEEGRRRIEEYNASVKAEQIPPAPGSQALPAPAVTQSPAPAIVIGLSGLLVLIGSVMPWATIASAFGSISVSGTQGDGKITLGAGILLLALAALQWGMPSTGARVFAALVGVGAGVVGVIDLTSMSSRVAEANLSAFVHAEAGVGLYLVIAGGALAVIGAVVGGRKTAP